MKLIIFLWNLVSKLFLPVTAVILLVFAVVTARRSIMIFKIKKMLTSRGMRDVKLRFLPNLLSYINTRDSLLGNGDKTVGGIVVYDINGFGEYLSLRK